MTAAQPRPVNNNAEISKRQEIASNWFCALRDKICNEFETIEKEISSSNPMNFERKQWARKNEDGSEGGGGEMSIMRGRVFEKVGVNISTVYGHFPENFRGQIPGANESHGQFWASGISLVAHMQSPLVPAVHMNTRMIVTSKSWFGGGADLTPTFPNETDTADFHNAFKECCDRHNPTYYPEYKEWCDRYFYLPHRQEPRGIGGIFYDYLDSQHWENDFSFTQDVGKTFLNIFPQLVRRHMHTQWTEEQREALLIKRGRYVEFNLVHDRGTQFGFKTGGNIEAILMSMPPEAKWP